MKTVRLVRKLKTTSGIVKRTLLESVPNQYLKEYVGKRHLSLRTLYYTTSGTLPLLHIKLV